MKKWLILSHGFNMDGRASSQTITDKIPYLIEAQIELYVLSAITGIQDKRFKHTQLIAWGPSAFRFDFRHWLANRVGTGLVYKLTTAVISLLLLPLIFIEKILTGLSSQWSWSLPAILRGFWWIYKYKIDVIYSTGGAWSAHLAGWALKKLTGRLWIVEIHDPLVIRHHPTDDGFSFKKNRDESMQIKLEKLIAADADLMWWFTEGALYWAKYRNPLIADKGFCLLPGAEPPTEYGKHSYGDKFNLSHFGSLSDSRSLKPILAVLPSFFKRHPESKFHICIHIYGSDLDSISSETIKNFDLQQNIINHGRLEYDAVSGLSGRAKIAKVMQESDLLLLLHGDYEGCSEYIPSKLYEYWCAKRPIFGITHISPQLDDLILKLNGTEKLTAHSLDEDSILLSLEFAYISWRQQSLPEVSLNPLGVNDAVSEILNRVSACLH